MNATRTEKQRTFYIVPDDFGGQHGTTIIPAKMTLREYRERKAIPPYKRDYFITDNYTAALYHTQA